MAVFLSREYYFPGQTVRGFAIIDAFNKIASNKLILRVKGKEVPNKYGPQIKKRMKESP